MVDLRDRRHMYEHKLNDTDDQILDFICDNDDSVTRMSIQALARELYTVPNTLTRLSRKLGYDGFSHMKNSLKDEMNERDEQKSGGAMYNLRKTMEVLDKETLNNVAKVIRASSRIFIYGLGDNQPFCETLSRHIKRGGKQSEYFTHRHDLMNGLDYAGKNDVLILLSMSGESEQIIEIARTAKEKSVTTVSLTHFSRNGLQALVDYRLFYYSPPSEASSSRISDKTPLMLAIQQLSDTFLETV